jgi:hypothetical protein
LIRVTVNRAAFERQRLAANAMSLKVGDIETSLTPLGVVHRRQMNAVFASQGAAGAAGRWAALSPDYAKRKRKAFGSRKILQLSGDMKARFTRASHPAYVQRVTRHGERFNYQFGAASDVAAAHLHGAPEMAPNRSSAARRVFFGGLAPHLPVRNMITKTASQFAEFKKAFIVWYANRARQVLRHIPGTGR